MKRTHEILLEELESLPDDDLRKGWTEWETEALVKYYPTKNTTEIARILKRSRQSVMAKAFKLGLMKKQE